MQWLLSTWAIDLLNRNSALFKAYFVSTRAVETTDSAGKYSDDIMVIHLEQ